ncbi:MAG TPA: ferrochelatase, partial [Gemmatimonadales bacterium]
MAAEPPQVAVLVMAYGGPGNLDEVEPYLMDVRGGRPTKPQLVEKIRARYARIGGRSPILELTRAQASGLGRALGRQFRVYVGMRHWHPYIQDVVAEIAQAGHARVVGVAMAPHYSNMSVGAYEKKLLQAADGRLDVSLVRTWWSQPQFLDAVADRILQALQRFPRPS